MLMSSSGRISITAFKPAIFNITDALLNSVNMGIAVGISLLSYIRAEIYVISYLLPVNGRHL